MTAISAALLLALGLASPALAAPAKSATATPFEQTTTVQGKVPIDIAGLWFLVAHVRMAKDPAAEKYRSFPQLIRIGRQKDGTVDLQLLDVRLPKEMAASVKTHNDKLEPWTPGEADLKQLAREVPRMKPVPDKDKDVVAGDVAFGQVKFTLASPDRYAEVYPRQDAAMTDVLSETAFALDVLEAYRGLPLPQGSNVAPLMQRHSIYGVRSAKDGVLEGREVVGFIAAGIGQPIPINTVGTFRMYRIGAAPKAAAAPAKSTGAAKPKAR